MSDALLQLFRARLPPEVSSLTEPYLVKLENGQYGELLQDSEAQALFGLKDRPVNGDGASTQTSSWNDQLFSRLGTSLADRTKGEKCGIFFCIGYAALLGFLQSNVTGPPLQFDPKRVLFAPETTEAHQRAIRQDLLESLAVDGIAPYKLAPHVELLCVADAIMSSPPVLKNVAAARWAKVRIGFIQQRMLSEVSSTLQNVIYDDLDLIEREIFVSDGVSKADDTTRAEFLIERATIHIHHGLDKLAREDLENAKIERHFEFALTGLLGKRTKFQEKDVSQLVVLAKSSDGSLQSNSGDQSSAVKVKAPSGQPPATQTETGPQNLNLDDDTLLESISFTQKPSDSTQIVDEKALSSSLTTIDPGNQPQLQSLDSSILLSLASSITNTSPQDGLTREETLPYATRVLDGGSANWQVYTQALLVRSRVEGYKSRTIERGLLQLQVLVDQVIADTTGATTASNDSASESQATTFLPRPKESEAAPVSERLRFIFQLASPTRWELEAELAARWTALGGLRSALDIYERLQMWAEAALCWAATEREDKARRLLRKQLFHATNGDATLQDDEVSDDETWSGAPRDPPPADAPRLYCILGDIDQSPEMYETAWKVSNQRYARAQRSLGRFYFAQNNYVKAAEAYGKSLKANQLNHPSWFALGCALLELQQFEKAVEAFSRCVQLDETDAESWSNLAAALLRKVPDSQPVKGKGLEAADDEDPSVVENGTSQDELQKNRQDALKALKRAATLKFDSYRIWENVLIVSASVSPADYASILTSQKHIIDLRGSTDGEKCIDVEIFELLVQHIIASNATYDPTKPGVERMTVKFIDENVTPLITGSAELWRIVSKLALWRGKPSSALDAEEKAWRVTIAQPGWETESEARWNTVVEATVRLCDSYESLGQQERTEGMGAGTPVAKNWRFKARTAVRGILGRGKASWEGTSGWDRLKDVMDGLKS